MLPVKNPRHATESPRRHDEMKAILLAVVASSVAAFAPARRGLARPSALAGSPFDFFKPASPAAPPKPALPPTVVDKDFRLSAIFLGLGLLVSFLQAFVFALLTMIYISMALEDPH